MSKEQVKIEIDGNLIDIEDFLRRPNKKYILEPNVYEIKKQILTDIRDYLIEKAELVRERDMEFLGQSAMLNLLAIEDKELKEYAEKLGVEL
jgi:hypothetical protein